LANATTSPPKQLVYRFQIDALVFVLYIDKYLMSSNLTFAGDKEFLIAACDMCTFTVVGPGSRPSAMVCAQASLVIMLQFGLSHTIVLDTDNKFYNTFKKTCQLMDLNVHTIGNENHDPMIIELVNRNLKKRLEIFTLEQGTLAVSRGDVLVLVYV
jgi:hypothetical protein